MPKKDKNKKQQLQAQQPAKKETIDPLPQVWLPDEVGEWGGDIKGGRGWLCFANESTQAQASYQLSCRIVAILKAIGRLNIERKGEGSGLAECFIRTRHGLYIQYRE